MIFARTQNRFTNMQSAIKQKRRKLKPHSKTEYETSVITMLLVDDDEVHKQSIINTLNEESCIVLSAKSSGEALNMMHTYPGIDIVLINVTLSGETGYEACRCLRRQYSFTDLPILMITENLERANWAESFRAGANDLLSKPVYMEKLKWLVSIYLKLKKLSEEVDMSELKLWQAQIKPHFLYNTLNTIISMSNDDAKRTRELLLELSTFLRKCFDFNYKSRFILLSKEMETVKAYLNIEQSRFGDRLQVEYDTDDTIVCEIPPLFIQPLVENAVKHGITKRKGGGKLKISIHSQSDYVSVVVADDGVGIPDLKLRALQEGTQENNQGIGIINIQRRLLRLYGESLQLESEVGVGTKISFRIPKNPK